jgi:RNA polymerase sigma-70 factor (sigma-E family)
VNTTASRDEASSFTWLETQYRSHATSLLRLATLLVHDRAAAEDVVHDAFVRLHRAGTVPKPGSELAYLRRTVVNLVAETGRRASVLNSKRAHLVPVPDAPSAERDLLRGDDNRALAQAVRGLPGRQRTCVIMHYWAEMTDSEVADALGISAGAVKSHLHRARAALAERLESRR